MTEIKSDKFHWVVLGNSDGASICLANRENSTLNCGYLDNLTKKELHLVQKVCPFTTNLLSNTLFILCNPYANSNKLVNITAPLYIRKIDRGTTSFREYGTYTGIWTNPKDIQFMCEFIKSNIPAEKIGDYGCYVDMKDI